MKKLLAILLALAILLPCGGYARAEENGELSAEAYEAVDSMWEELNLAETRAKKGRENRTTAQAVAAAVEENDLYVDGTLHWQGENQFSFETTAGITCGYSSRLRNIAKNAGNRPAPAGPEIQTVSYGNSGSREIYLIEPYYGLDDNFTEQYQKQAKDLAEALKGTYHLYMRNEATVQAVADAVEKGSVVFFDSHGETDYARGTDYVSGATTSYLLLQSGEGLTRADYKKDENGTYHAIDYGMDGNMHFYAVDGTCIARHMKHPANGNLLWMSLCLGMATDGLLKPLREKGVSVVYGYSQSVTFEFDYLWGDAFWREMKNEKTVSEAIAAMKKEVGQWDSCDLYPTLSSALKHKCAFPIVASAEDPYPGSRKADVLQKVCSSWTLIKTCPHTEVKTEKKQPTCTEKGYKKVTCVLCGEVLSYEEYSALGHDYEAVITPPGCTEQGFTTYTCRRCGESYVADYVPAAGHRFINGICQVCGQEHPCEYYTDVHCGDWFFDGVVSAYENNLMKGTGNSLFEPEEKVTRAMVTMALYRKYGSPEREESSRPFSDIPEGAWYEDAVFWAADLGIVNGTGEGKFSPEEPITREQIAAILWRCTAPEKTENEKLEFPDAENVSDYAAEAVKWTVRSGIINGMDGKLAPGEAATRAQLALILTRWLETV